MPVFDVAVLSSRSEGLSNTLIEYAAAGLPIVATDVGGNGEVVAHGENGYLVPPGRPDQLADAIVQLLRDPALRATFGRAGQAKVAREFDEETVTGAYVDYYQSLVRERSRKQTMSLRASSAEGGSVGTAGPKCKASL